MAKTHHRPGFSAARTFLILILLMSLQSALPREPLAKPVHATTMTSLGIWSSAFQSNAVLDSTLTPGSFVKFRLNATGGLSINGFDITVLWDPAIVTGKNATFEGGIFDTPACTCNIRQVLTDHLRMAGTLLGTHVPANGTVFTFTLEVQALGSSIVDIDESSSFLTRPAIFRPPMRDGFFSNLPSDGDLILASVSVSQESVPLGDVVQIFVGVKNLGSVTMMGVAVSVVANNTIPINSTAVGSILPNSAQTVTLVWNTTGYSLGLYNLNATVTTTSQDSFLGDNSLSLEQVMVVIHDVGVVSLTAPASALVNSTVQLSLDLENKGTVEDLANVTILANATLVRFTFMNRTSLAVTLAPGETRTISAEWDTKGIAAGRYSLKVMVAAVPGESNLANNQLNDGTIILKTGFDHDLQIVGFLPGEAIIGQNLTLTFIVRNNGIFNEDYSLKVFLGGQSIFVQNGLLPAFTNQTVSSVWNTRPYTAGTYDLRANVTINSSTDENPANNELSASFTLSANRPPIATFDLSSSVGQPGVAVAFDANKSSDPEAFPLQSYSWNFGDGSPTLTGLTVTHVYPDPGTYTITLTVTDNFGATSTRTKDLRVNSSPLARFSVSLTTAAIGVEISFAGNSSSDSDGTIASYQWNFGDGTTADGKTVKHAYSSPGSYQATLTVTDSDGAKNESTLTIEVTAAAFPQVVLLTVAGVGVVAALAGGWFFLTRKRKEP